MQFFKPEYFLYLWMVPAVLAVHYFSHRLWQKRIYRLVQDEKLLSKLVDGHRKNEWLFRAILMMLAVLCFVLALARPQWGDEKRTAQRKGVDIVFMLDTSLSMLAEDIKPNRLEKAKFEIETFIRNLRGDRIGMVTFAGSGFLQTPLTLDHSAFLLFLDAAQIGFLPDPGTSLVQAIHLAIRAFPQKELKYKALILLTDGEDHEGGVEKAIEEAKQANVRIYALGFGTTEGEPIPLRNEKGDRSGFKKDRGGQMVLTRLNPPLLEKIAKETGGIYLQATPGEKEVDVILKHLRGWGEQQFAEKMFVEHEDQYQMFLILALIFIIAEMLLRRKDKNPTAWMACLAAFFLLTGFFETSQDTVKKGNEHFQNKRYQSALEAYRKVQVKKPDVPEVLYDLGTALYKVDAFQESAKDLEAAALKAKEPQFKARALYNKGNVQYRLGNFEEAIDAYKKVLALDPGDKDAKYNLEFLQKQKNKFDKKDREQKKEDQKKEPRQDQQKNKQEQQQNQGQGEGQNNQDPQSQKQKDQQQQQSQPQDQRNQDQQQKPQSQDQQSQDQQQKSKEQEQGEKEKQRQEEQQSQQEQRERQEQEKEQQTQQEQKNARDERQEQQKRPLQGQMSMDNALNLLDALKESERELKDLRRPQVNKNAPPVDKDW